MGEVTLVDQRLYGFCLALLNEADTRGLSSVLPNSSAELGELTGSLRSLASRFSDSHIDQSAAAMTSREESLLPIDSSELGLTFLCQSHMIQLANCDPNKISYLSEVMPILKKAVEKTGGTYLEEHTFQFTPLGATGVLLIPEGHIAIHTWPEKKYAALCLHTRQYGIDLKQIAAYVSEEITGILKADHAGSGGWGSSSACLRHIGEDKQAFLRACRNASTYSAALDDNGLFPVPNRQIGQLSYSLRDLADRLVRQDQSSSEPGTPKVERESRHLSIMGGGGGQSEVGRYSSEELFDCNDDRILHAGDIKKVMIDAVKRSGATYLDSSFTDLKPFGFVGVVLLAESHVILRTSPLERYAIVDVFTCGERADPDKIAGHVIESLKA